MTFSGRAAALGMLVFRVYKDLGDPPSSELSDALTDAEEKACLNA